MSMESERRRISNRVALAVGGIALSVAVAGGVKMCSAEAKTDGSPTPSSPTLTLEPSQTPVSTEQAPQEGLITLGEEKDLSLAELGISWTPDGHIPYISLSNGQKRFFTVGINKTYIIATSGESLQSAIESNVLSNPKNFREVLGRAQNPDYNYSGITSVFQLDGNDENHLTAILHQEEWASEQNGSGFRASIGVFESFDAGLNWTNGRTIIKGDDLANPGEVVSGAGQPNAIQVGEYLYIYHIDWSAHKVVNHPDQIYLARTKIVDGTIDNNIEYLAENGFSADNSNLKPVIPVPASIENAAYSALPSISFNKYLNQYLCILETNVGFAQTTSVDGINWSEPKLILEFPQPQSDRQINQLWNSYPTLLSDNQEPNDHTTDKSGTLYYSEGYWTASSHNLVAQPFELK